MLLNNIWVVNMDKSTDRLEKVKNNLDKLGLEFNRFRAVNGKELSKEQVDLVATPLCQNILCNYGIVGCAQSHKELWKQLVQDDKTNYYLILEDDALMTEKSVEIIKKLEPKFSEYSIDYLSLYCNNPGCSLFETKFKIDGLEFGKPIFPLSTVGYIITKQGAAKLLEQLGKTDYHIDFEIAVNRFRNDFNYYTSNKPIVETDDDDTSTIGMKNNLITYNILNSVGLNYYSWVLNNPIFTIKMYYVINAMLIILILLLVLNKKMIKSDILFWFIILELFLYNSSYLL